MRWLSCLVVLGFGLCRVSHSGDKELEFAGKKTSEWLKILKESKEVKARQGSLIALEVIGARARGVHDAILDALAGDTEPDIRREAAALLGRMVGDTKTPTGEKEAFVAANALAEAIARDKDGAVRETAAIALGGKLAETGKKQILALQMLTKALRDPHMPVRTAAAETLKNYREDGKHAFTELVVLARDADSDSIARRFAIQAVSRFKDLGDKDVELVVTAFSKLISDETAPFGVRESALEGLGFMKSEKTVGGLVEGLKTSDVELRRMAMRGLVALKDKARPAWTHVNSAMKDADSFVRGQAIVVCGFVAKAEPEAIGLLVAAAEKDRTLENRISAIQALGDLGAVASPALKTLDALAMNDARANVRDAAKQAAKRIRAS